MSLIYYYCRINMQVENDLIVVLPHCMFLLLHKKSLCLHWMHVWTHYTSSCITGFRKVRGNLETRLKKKAELYHPGAHNPERPTSMRSYHGIFTDQFIFRMALVRILNILWIPQTSQHTCRPKNDIFYLLMTFSFPFRYLIVRMRL